MENKESQTKKEALINKAVKQAEKWQKRANQLLLPQERKLQNQMEALLKDPLGKVIFSSILDQSFRSQNEKRIADQINFLFKKYGIPGFLSKTEKKLVQLFSFLQGKFSKLTVPFLVEKLRENSSQTIIDGKEDVFLEYLKSKRAADVGVIVNHLGEAVLGEKEAENRLQGYLNDLRNPFVQAVSAKVSTLYSQINPLAFEDNIKILKERLEKLYQAAMANRYKALDGTWHAKFVNLDMEAYRDLQLTLEVFKLTLSQREFQSFNGGIVLQSYIPDSYVAQLGLTEWAKERYTITKTPIKMRLVKGANLEAEQVESIIRGWPLPLYDNKLDVDSNFKKMLHHAMRPENIQAVNLGVASHNLFELAYAWVLAKEYNVQEYLSFELLQGMANHLERALREDVKNLWVYAPVATREHFLNAITYLIRRLDENTGEKNFLRYAPNLTSRSQNWQFLKEQFEDSCRKQEEISIASHSRKKRISEKDVPSKKISTEFTNEPDTDWSLEDNQDWANEIRDEWQNINKDKGLITVPLVIDGEEIHISEEKKYKKVFDISEWPQKEEVARCVLADSSQIQRAIKVAKSDSDYSWQRKSILEKRIVFKKVAQNLRQRRGDLIGVAALETGKVFAESDSEISEAIDFVEFYARSAQKFHNLSSLEIYGKGVALVISPWNFPVAIPCGGIAGSLIAGNRVIFKPSTDSILTAYLMCQCFWNAGVSKKILQFVPCCGDENGEELTTHPDVNYVILTGGTQTGLNILEAKPDIFLSAETGGKNSMIITDMADKDQAISHLIHSAFSHGGQKCSACSLLILEESVFNDPKFKKQLEDAVTSLKVGSVWNFKNKYGPLIHSPRRDLQRALTQLEPGEKWLVKPENINDHPHLWMPGVKWNVQPGSFTHLTEFFGPVLGVMKARNLEEAIDLANQVSYGLTTGLESLDPREWEIWKERIQAGNLYINKGTTGAIVLRQPFGGMKDSAIGSGTKAGGVNYVTQFMTFKEIANPSVGALKNNYHLLQLVERWQNKAANSWGEYNSFVADFKKTALAIRSYLYNAEQEFYREKDYFHLRGQDNITRYLPLKMIKVRIHEDDSMFETLARIAAVRVVKGELVVSVSPDLDNKIVKFLESSEGKNLLGDARIVRQTDEEVIAMLPFMDRLRYARPERVPEKVYEAAAKTGFYIARTPVLMEGRIELLQYFREQAICINYHRYGNISPRELELK